MRGCRRRVRMGGWTSWPGVGRWGLEAPRLVVQVKSQDAKVDVRVLRELSGVMGRMQADQGLLVGWGGFNHAVRAEAASDYFRLRLWDAEDVVRCVGGAICAVAALGAHGDPAAAGLGAVGGGASHRRLERL